MAKMFTLWDDMASVILGIFVLLVILIWLYKQKNDWSLYQSNTCLQIIINERFQMKTFFSSIFTLFILLLLITPCYSGEYLGTIRRQSGSTSSNTYGWDGKTLRPLSGATCHNSYSFDGRILRPMCNSHSSNTYIWNNRVFHLRDGSTSANSWKWNGRVLGLLSGANSANTWSFDGKVWRLKQNTNSHNSWMVSGYIPIPVCALVLLGIF